MQDDTYVCDISSLRITDAEEAGGKGANIGVPCVVGTRTATRDLHDGTTVTVDGTHGRVLFGRVDAAPQASVVERRAPAEPQSEVTGTKIYVNLAMPDTAEAVAVPAARRTVAAAERRLLLGSALGHLDGARNRA